MSIKRTLSVVCSFGFLLTVIEAKQETCLEKAKNILFVLDSSSSIRIQNYKEQLQFVADLVDSIASDHHKRQARVGVITFSNAAYLEFPLGRYSQRAQLKKAIANIMYRTGGTNTGEALRMVRSQVEPIIAIENGPIVAIVITDGGSSDRNKTKAEADKLHRLGVHVYAIGVGDENQYDIDELKAIASDPVQGVYTVATYSALKEITEKVHAQPCEEYTTTLKEFSFTDTINQITTPRPPWRPITRPPWRPITRPPWRPTTRPPWRPITRPPWRPTTRPPWRPITRPPWRTTTRSPWRPITRPPWRPTTRPPWRPTTRPPWRPITRPPWRPTTRPPWKPITRPPWIPTFRPPTTTRPRFPNFFPRTTKKPQNPNPKQTRNDRSSAVIFGYDIMSTGSFPVHLITKFINSFLKHSGYGYFRVITNAYCPKPFQVPIPSLIHKAPLPLQNLVPVNVVIPSLVDIVREMNAEFYTRAIRYARAGRTTNQVAILFIDPLLTVITPELIVETQKLKENGVRLFVINVGQPNLPQAQPLQLISSRPFVEYIYNFPMYDQPVYNVRRAPFVFKDMCHVFAPNIRLR